LAKHRFGPKYTPSDIQGWRDVLGRHDSVAEALAEIGVPMRTFHSVFERLGEHAGQWLRTPQKKPGPARGKPKADRTTRILICPDVHIPYQDPVAWECFLRVAEQWKPDILVLLGDVVDFYQVSVHPKDPTRKITFQEEIAATNQELGRVGALKVPEVVYCEGNHETRLQRMLTAQAPQLVGMVDVRDLLQVDRRGWTWVPYGTHHRIGKLHFTHDIGHCGVYAARQSSMAFGHNIIFGHTHRAGAHYESTVNGDRHVAWMMGWLGDPSAIDYQHRAKVMRNSQHGFGIAHLDQHGNGWVHFVPIIEGTCVVDGVVYRAPKVAA
jgi:predicted phosphodiesterase